MSALDCGGDEPARRYPWCAGRMPPEVCSDYVTDMCDEGDGVVCPATLLPHDFVEITDDGCTWTQCADCGEFPPATFVR